MTQGRDSGVGARGSVPGANQAPSLARWRGPLQAGSSGPDVVGCCPGCGVLISWDQDVVTADNQDPGRTLWHHFCMAVFDGAEVRMVSLGLSPELLVP